MDVTIITKPTMLWFKILLWIQPMSSCALFSLTASEFYLLGSIILASFCWSFAIICTLAAIGVMILLVVEAFPKSKITPDPTKQ